MSECDVCQGEGECRNCDGAGYFEAYEYGAGDDKETPCSNCGGSGKCPACDGLGVTDSGEDEES